MIDLSLSEVLLLSVSERKARRVKLDPTMTLILGPNRTGKSAFIKSIYHAFGAEPYVIPSDWLRAGVATVVRFTLGGAHFAVVRRANLFALFSEGELLGAFSGVSGGFSATLAELLQFGLQLPSRDNKPETPPPAFFFLPYYIDQDGGWSKPWHSFARLTQFANWKTSLIEYHTGVRDNEYYSARARLDSVRAERTQAEAEASVLKGLQRRVVDDPELGMFDLNMDSFRDRLDEFLRECELLRSAQERSKVELGELANRKALVDIQIGLVEAALKETSADYAFAAESLADEVECPTCGATYENSFAERFAIASDENRLTDFSAELRAESDDLAAEIEIRRSRLNRQQADAARVERLLETQRNEVTLQTVVRSVGRNEVRSLFREELTENYRRVQTATNHESGLKQQLRAIDKESRERRDDIYEEYQARLRGFTRALQVDPVPAPLLKRMDARINATGSALPRMILAYYFSLIHVMRRHAPSTFAPLVIDTPNQQGQDPATLTAILSFIRDNRPHGSQTVLGLEHTHGVDFPGEVVWLDRKHSLLSEDEYESVAAQVTPLVQAASATLL